MREFFGDNISIRRLTKGELPSLPFVKIKEAVLGKKYDLSIVFVGDKLSNELNLRYRGKDKPTNILSFPISKTSGEIFMNLNQTRKDAKEFERKYDNFVAFTLLHGFVHLKGYDHGDEMEKIEIKFRKKFDI